MCFLPFIELAILFYNCIHLFHLSFSDCVLFSTNQLQQMWLNIVPLQGTLQFLLLIFVILDIMVSIIFCQSPQRRHQELLLGIEKTSMHFISVILQPSQWNNWLGKMIGYKRVEMEQKKNSRHEKFQIGYYPTMAKNVLVTSFLVVHELHNGYKQNYLIN